MTGALALVAALSISSQIQTRPAGLDSIGPSRGRSLRTAPIMDKLYQQANKPALDFNFARFKDLHDDATGATSLVTFSRSAAQSPGTYVSSDGLIKTAAVNLQLYSEEFDQWTNSNTTDLANQVDAPDGKQTADEIEATAANGTIVRGVTTTAIDYTFSVYLKRKTGTGDIDISVDGSTWVTQPVTGDWQRFSVTQTGVAGTSNAGIRLVTSGDEVYAWGAQLEEGTTATPYIHTTSQALAAPRFDHDPVTGESLGLLVEEQRTNLWTYSGDPDDSSWLLFGATRRTTSPIAAPDGTSISTVFDFSATGNRAVYKSIAASGNNTVSAYFRTESGTETMYFTLNNGPDVYSQPFTVTDEWQRFSFTLDTTGGTGVVAIRNGAAGGAKSVYVWGVQFETGSFPTSYIPTVTSQTRYADVAAVQDEDFSTTNLLSYSESFDVGWLYPGTTATVTANATAAPDGQTTADLITAGATGNNNYIGTSTPALGIRTASFYVKKNTADFVAVNFGSGTADSAWFDLSNGTTAKINGGGSSSITDVGNGWYRITHTKPSGQNYVFLGVRDADGGLLSTSGKSVYIWGASLTATEYPVDYVTTRNLLKDSQDFERSTWSLASATIGNDVAQAPDGTITADDATATGANATVRNATTTLAISYTFSVYLKRKTGTGDIDISVDGTTWVTQSVTSAWQRFTVTQTGVAGTSNPGVRIVGSGDAVYLYGAQLEPGSTASDYVRTVDTVGKRYGWYEPTEGTVFVEAQNPASGTRGVVGIDDNTANERIEAQTDGTDPEWLVIDNGSGPTIDAGSVTAYTFFSLAGAYKHNDLAASVNGGAAVTDTDTIPSVNRMRIGALQASGTYLNGHIKRLTYWPTRQSDSTLQVITQ